MIKYTATHSNCLECGIRIDDKVLNYSIEQFRHPLCREHQDWLRDIHEHSTAAEESIKLYFALKQREVPALLEKDDGFKTIDIAVPHAKVNIEVDGRHHNYSAKQALSDLKRTLYSFKKGYTTLRIPNSLVKDDLEQTAELITEYLIVSRDTTQNKPIIFKKVNSNKTEAKKTHFGYCVRTGVEIPFNKEKPLSKEVWEFWKKYSSGNKDSKERFCHFSGEESNGETSFNHPILKKNWKKAKEIFDL